MPRAATQRLLAHANGLALAGGAQPEGVGELLLFAANSNGPAPRAQ